MYYVYELIDPRNASVFYVGKGKGRRYEDHVKDAMRGVVSEKCGLIRAIHDSGHKVAHRIVQRFPDEAAAYAFEAKHIAAIGLASLTNLMRGGGSLVGRMAWAKGTASIIARALAFVAAGNRILVLGYDVTDATLGMIDRVRRDWGLERFAKAMAVEGVHLVHG